MLCKQDNLVIFLNEIKSLVKKNYEMEGKWLMNTYSMSTFYAEKGYKDVF